VGITKKGLYQRSWEKGPLVGGLKRSTYTTEGPRKSKRKSGEKGKGGDYLKKNFSRYRDRRKKKTQKRSINFKR